MAGGLRYAIELNAAGIAERAESAARMAAQSAAEAVLARANAIAPRRSGAMAASARIEAEGTRARVSYGTIYARLQHDRTGWRHPGGGQALFLAKAAEAPEAAAALVESFAAHWK